MSLWMLQLIFLLSKKRISLSRKYICICFNTSCYTFELIHFEVDSGTAYVITVQCPKSLTANTGKFRVCSLTWNRSDSLIFGCLKSGSLFISSRHGQLLRIFNNIDCSEKSTLFLNLFNECSEDDTSEASSINSSRKISYSVIAHKSKDVILLSSGFTFYSLLIPSSLSTDNDLASSLLKTAHYANHRLEELCIDHQYDFIHGSSWKLAKSLADLTKEIPLEVSPKTKINIWLLDNLLPPPPSPFRSLTDHEIQIDTSFTSILSSWNVIATSSSYERKPLSLLKKCLIKETLKLFHILLTTCSYEDVYEHQMRMIQILKMFHQMLSVFDNYHFRLHLLNPVLKIMDKTLKLVFNSSRTVHVLLVLTQMLAKTEKLLIQSYSSFLNRYCNAEYNSFNCLPLQKRLKSSWDFLEGSLVLLWKDTVEDYSIENYRKYSLILNLIQGKTVPVKKFQKIKVSKYFRTFSLGKIYRTIEEIKKKLIFYIDRESPLKSIKYLCHFAFYSLVIKNAWEELYEFVLWLYKDLFSCCLFKESLHNDNLSKKRKKYLHHFVKLLSNIANNFGVVIARTLQEDLLFIPRHFKPSRLPISGQDLPTRRILYLGIDFPSFWNMSLACEALILGENWNEISKIAKKFNNLKLLFCASYFNKDCNGDFHADCRETVENYLLRFAKTEQIHSNSYNFLHKIQTCLKAIIILNGENVIESVLQRLLTLIQDHISDLSLLASNDSILPPIFCPQFLMEEEVVTDEKSDSALLFQISSLVSLFVGVCVASKLSCNLLSSTLRNIQEEGLNDSIIEECISSLEANQKVKWPAGANWESVKGLWNKFIELIWTVHIRNNLSCSLQMWIQDKALQKKFSLIKEKAEELTKWLREAIQLNESWKDDCFSLLLSVILDAPLNEQTVDTLALSLSYFRNVPSLLSNKLDTILNNLKGIGTNYDSDGRSLFDFYRERLHGYKDRQINKNVMIFGPLANEFVNMVGEFSSVCFVKYDKVIDYTPWPLLEEFKTELMDYELNSLEWTAKLKNLPNVNDEGFKKKKNVPNVILKEKKGLFRSLKGFSKCSSCAKNKDVSIIYTPVNSSEQPFPNNGAITQIPKIDDYLHKIREINFESMHPYSTASSYSLLFTLAQSLHLKAPAYDAPITPLDWLILNDDELVNFSMKKNCFSSSFISPLQMKIYQRYKSLCFGFLKLKTFNRMEGHSSDPFNKVSLTVNVTLNNNNHVDNSVSPASIEKSTLDEISSNNFDHKKQVPIHNGPPIDLSFSEQINNSESRPLINSHRSVLDDDSHSNSDTKTPLGLLQNETNLHLSHSYSNPSLYLKSCSNKSKSNSYSDFSEPHNQNPDSPFTLDGSAAQIMDSSKFSCNLWSPFIIKNESVNSNSRMFNPSNNDRLNEADNSGSILEPTLNDISNSSTSSGKLDGFSNEICESLVIHNTQDSDDGGGTFEMRDKNFISPKSLVLKRLLTATRDDEIRQGVFQKTVNDASHLTLLKMFKPKLNTEQSVAPPNWVLKNISCKLGYTDDAKAVQKPPNLDLKLLKIPNIFHEENINKDNEVKVASEEKKWKFLKSDKIFSFYKSKMPQEKTTKISASSKLCLKEVGSETIKYPDRFTNKSSQTAFKKTQNVSTQNSEKDVFIPRKIFTDKGLQTDISRQQLFNTEKLSIEPIKNNKSFVPLEKSKDEIRPQTQLEVEKIHHQQSNNMDLDKILSVGHEEANKVKLKEIPTKPYGNSLLVIEGNPIKTVELVDKETITEKISEEIAIKFNVETQTPFAETSPKRPRVMSKNVMADIKKSVVDVFSQTENKSCVLDIKRDVVEDKLHFYSKELDRTFDYESPVEEIPAPEKTFKRKVRKQKAIELSDNSSSSEALVSSKESTFILNKNKSLEKSNKQSDNDVSSELFFKENLPEEQNLQINVEEINSDIQTKVRHIEKLTPTLHCPQELDLQAVNNYPCNLENINSEQILNSFIKGRSNIDDVLNVYTSLTPSKNLENPLKLEEMVCIEKDVVQSEKDLSALKLVIEKIQKAIDVESRREKDTIELINKNLADRRSPNNKQCDIVMTAIPFSNLQNHNSDNVHHMLDLIACEKLSGEIVDKILHGIDIEENTTGKSEEIDGKTLNDISLDTCLEISPIPTSLEKSKSVKSARTPHTDKNHSREDSKLEIRKWMRQRKRKRFLEASPRDNSSSRLTPLTAKELKVQNTIREQKRAKLKENHMKKREEYLSYFLDECLEESQSFRVKSSLEGSTIYRSHSEIEISEVTSKNSFGSNSIPQTISVDSTSQESNDDVRNSLVLLTDVLKTRKSQRIKPSSIPSTMNLLNDSKIPFNTPVATTRKFSLPLERISEGESESSQTGTNSKGSSDWEIPIFIKNILHSK